MSFQTIFPLQLKRTTTMLTTVPTSGGKAREADGVFWGVENE